MTDIYRNPITNNFDVDISVVEWKEILRLPQIQGCENILIAIEIWYLAPDYTSSCKSLGEQYGYDYNFFSVQNKRLGKIAVKHLNRFRLIGNNGKETYWGVAWIELKKENGRYIFRLRSELIDAIKSLGLFDKNTDDIIKRQLLNYDFSHELIRFEFLHEKREKPIISKKIMKSFTRDFTTAKNALLHAEFKCEFNALHDTFPRRVDGRPYVETHHLIPLKYVDYFESSIDVPENIVCLCSTCHNRIHYGRNNREVIEYLWSLRKNDLCKAGINIDLCELLNFYSIFKS